jgi:hypothetical protein
MVFALRSAENAIDHDRIGDVIESLGSEREALLDALLDEDGACWRFMYAAPELVSYWWGGHGDLAVLQALARCRDLPRFSKEFGFGLLELAVEFRLTTSDISQASEIADAVGEDRLGVLRHLAETGALDSKAPSGELRREPRRSFLAAFWRRLHPAYLLRLGAADGVASAWAIHGMHALVERGPVLRVTEAFGLSLEDARGLPDAVTVSLAELASEPIIGLRLNRVTRAQRLQLLPALASYSAAHLRHVDLDTIARAKDPSAALSIAVHHHLPAKIAVGLAEGGISEEKVAALHDVACLALGISNVALLELAELEATAGQKAALGVAEQETPGAIAAARAWGLELAPLICGSDGAAVLATLAALSPREHVAAFIAGAGHQGISELASRGQAYADLVAFTCPPADDCLLLGAALDASNQLPTLARRVYQLGSASGVPVRYWPEMANFCRRFASDERVLLALFLRDPGRSVAIAGR